MKTPILELVEVSEADTPAAAGINESFWALDAIVQLAVLDKDLSTAPAATQGDRYIVAESPVGDWAGHARHIAYMTPDGWLFRTPRPGWKAYVLDEEADYIFTENSEWESVSGSGASAFDDFVGGNAEASLFEVSFLAGIAHEVTLQGNVALRFTDAVAGKVCRTTLIVRQDDTGGRGLSWPAATFWPGGALPPVSTLALSVHVYDVVTYDGGISFYSRLVAGSFYNGDVVPAPYPSTDDAYWPYVAHLLHMDGINNGTSFPDEKGATVTRVGTPVTVTAHKKFGTASGSFSIPSDYYAGTGKKYLSLPASDANDMTTGDFCIEMFVKMKAVSAPVFYGDIFLVKGDETSDYFLMFTSYASATRVSVIDPSGSGVSVIAWNAPSTPGGDGQLSDSEFRHIFCERRHGRYFVGINGYMWSDGEDHTDDEVDLSMGPLQIGGGVIDYIGTPLYVGSEAYIDEVRVTVGAARYAPLDPTVLDPLHYFTTYTPPNTVFSGPASYTGEVKTPRRTIGATWTTGSAEVVLAPSNDVFVRVPNRSKINRSTILTEGGTGSCEIDVRMDTLANFPPTGADSILAASPALGIDSGISYDDETLEGWTTTQIPAGSVLGFHLVDSDLFTSVTILLEIEDIQ